MEKSKKLNFLAVVLASVLLASCSGSDTPEEGSPGGAGADSTQGADGAAVTPMTGETVEGSEGSGSDKPPVTVDDMPTVFYFDFDKSALSADVREELDIVASLLKVSGASVRLLGHADERGTREYNLALGERRAKAVQSYLSVQGVDKSKLEVISYGEEKPADAASNEAAWAKNRRVEIAQ